MEPIWALFLQYILVTGILPFSVITSISQTVPSYGGVSFGKSVQSKQHSFEIQEIAKVSLAFLNSFELVS